MRAGRCLTLLLLCASCKDEGVQQHRQALEKYATCVDRGVAPTDPCFTEVLTLLAAIPPGSTARPRAEALREGLLTARQPRIRTPLAVQGGVHLGPEVLTQLEQCQRLAEDLGQTAEADRPAKVLKLEACRASAEKLDIARVHGDHDGGAH